MKIMIIKLLKATLFLLIILGFSSCMKKKKEIERLKQANSNIQRIADERTDVILDYVVSMNEIQHNLDSIKMIQKLVNMNFSSSKTEMRKTVKEQIIDDIELLNSLLDQNKKIVSDLQKKLDKSDNKNKEFAQLIKSFTIRIEEKDFEISRLNAQLADLEKHNTKLNKQIDELAIESILLTDEVEEQDKELNAVYYCFGSEDELIENNVIERVGGFLGMGKSLKVKSDFNQDYFREEDQREFDEVLLMTKKAQMLTYHPDSSYHIIRNEGVVQKIVIEDPATFWKVSNYLILLVK